MASLRVDYSVHAISPLEALYVYIAEDAGPIRAESFVSSLMTYCEGLGSFPYRGTRRDDIRPGLRLLGYRRRVTIAFTVNEAAVIILGVFYGGRDVEAFLRS